MEQNTTKKRQVDETYLEFEANDDEEYKVKGIRDSAVYVKASEAGQLLGLYYLVSWKNYPEEKDTWKPISAVQYLQKLLIKFHYKNLNKPIAMSHSVDIASSMAKPTIKLFTKWK